MTDWKESERKHIIQALNRIADNIGRIANGTKMELTDDEIKAIKKLQGTGTLEEEWLKRPMYPSEWKLIFGELPKEYKAQEVETGWGELFLLDGMSQSIKKEMDELLKSPWAQDKTFTPHDMAVKEAFAIVKDLILSKFEIKEGWENLIHR